jgi:HK97 family phage major capsid protein/HK97 family phage prohead protease
MEKRTWKAELRAGKGKTIVGKIPYNSLSDPIGGEGGFLEKLSPGCFTRNLEMGWSVLALIQHDATKVIGNTDNGSLELRDATDALHFIIRPADTTYANDFMKLVRDGTITGTSFGFDNIESSWEENGTRCIDSARLIEISPCVFNAYPEATIEARTKQYNTSKGKNMNINDMRQKRGEVLHQMRSLLDQGLTNENQESYDAWDIEFEELTNKIKLEERTETLSQSQGIRTGRPSVSQPNMRGEARSKPVGDGDVAIWLPGTFRADTMSESETRSIAQKFGYESRSLEVDSDTSGGYTVSSEVLAQQILAFKMNAMHIRKLATVITVRDAQSLGIPTLGSDPASAEWTSELLIGGAADDDMVFEGRSLSPKPISKSIKISKTLIRRNPNIVPFVIDRLSYKFQVPEESAFMTGNGVNKPLGVFTASELGVSTSRDISAGNTATAFTADGLINAKYHLKAQYRTGPSVSWCFSRDAVKMIRKQKDGSGNYLWQMGLQGKPDSILDLPYFESEYAPATFAASSYLGCLADWSYYWIAEALNMTVEVATELLIQTNQNLYVGRAEIDAMPVLEEAFVRVKTTA